MADNIDNEICLPIWLRNSDRGITGFYIIGIGIALCRFVRITKLRRNDPESL